MSGSSPTAASSTGCGDPSCKACRLLDSCWVHEHAARLARISPCTYERWAASLRRVADSPHRDQLLAATERGGPGLLDAAARVC